MCNFSAQEIDDVVTMVNNLQVCEHERVYWRDNYIIVGLNMHYKNLKCNTPNTHSHFGTKILLRSEVKENDLRTHWELYKHTEDSVYTH